MNIKAMHYDFDIKIDKVDNLSKSDFNVAEKDWLLNEAQLVIIKNRYGIRNNDRIGFEGNQKRIDDLSSLVIKFPNQPIITPIEHNNGTLEIDLASLAFPYLFLIRSFAQVDGCSTGVSLRFIQHDDLNYLLEDPFNSPSVLEIPYNLGRSSNTVGGTSIYIYPGNVVVTGVYLEYIKFPNRINLA